MRLLLIRGSILFILFSPLSSLAQQRVYDPPRCPTEINVKSGVISGAGDWQVSVADIFIKGNGVIAIHDGVLKTDGMYPSVGVLRKGSPIHVSTDAEEYTDEYEMFWWNEKTFERNDAYIYMCNASGPQSEHPVAQVTLYKVIPQNVSSCMVKLQLVNEERTWGGQKMECYINP